MPRKTKQAVVKTEEIRKALQELPKKTPVKEVIAFLSDKGIDVKPSLVSYVKYKRPDLSKACRRKRRKNQQPTSLKQQIIKLMEFKSLCDKYGGISHCREMMREIEKLQEIIDF